MRLAASVRPDVGWSQVSIEQVCGLAFIAFACAEFYQLGLVESVRHAAWLGRLGRYLNGTGMMCFGMGSLLSHDLNLALLFSGLGLGLMLASVFASFAQRWRSADSPR